MNSGQINKLDNAQFYSGNELKVGTICLLFLPQSLPHLLFLAKTMPLMFSPEDLLFSPEAQKDNTAPLATDSADRCS